MPGEQPLNSMQIGALMRRALLPWLLLLVPVALIDLEYPLLPKQLPLLRDWSGTPQLWAAKSAFAAFRIPLMGVVLAMAVTLMWWQALRDANAARRQIAMQFWFILLYATAFKSLFEGLQFVSDLQGPAFADLARWSWYGTLAAVGGGLLLAAIPGRKWLRAPAHAFPRLPLLTKVALCVLLAGYVVLAAAPMLIAVRG